MYHIALYEDGRFCTVIGGEQRTVDECAKQIERLSDTVCGEALQRYVGCKWHRNGSVCALIVVSESLAPVFDFKAEKEV